jgi:oxygen-independent coproporphyrinogen-3 oxidase
MEIAAYDLKPQTVFFGGGTPSLLNLRQWETILRAMEKLNLLGAEEFSIECNPATVSLDKAKLFRSFGVNRISMGVQSLDEKLLDRLGRIHSREMVFKSFDILRAADFKNVNLDLMFAIPTQTMDIWRDTLNEATAMQSEHLSSYEVIYEDDTPLFQQLQAGEFCVDENLACEMYDELISSATRAGFHQYEIANFAKQSKAQSPKPKVTGNEITLDIGHWTLDIPFFACKHNVNYWRGGNFYGLGPSATGYVRGVRTKNWSNTQLYCEQLENGKRAIESREELPPLKRAGETAAFGLRMNAGWPFTEFQRATNFDLRNEWSQEMNQLAERGWAARDAEKFQLTPQGLRFADSAAELFLR